jgi:hypothetical protein
MAFNKPGIKSCSPLSTGVSPESGNSSEDGKQSNGLYFSMIDATNIYVDYMGMLFDSC